MQVVISLNRANVPFIVPLIVQKKVNTQGIFFVNENENIVLNSLGVNLHTARKMQRSLQSTERGFTGQTFKSVGKWSVACFFCFFVFKEANILLMAPNSTNVPIPVFNFQVNFTERGKKKAT